MFRPMICIAVLCFFASCSSTRYYVVRHAEKAAPTGNMTSDVPLSEAGSSRALALRDSLGGHAINTLWSSNTIRTRSTLQPYSTQSGIPIRVYSNDSLDHYISRWKSARGNLLIAGHSNTVDNIVNALLGQSTLTDLPDSQYGDLFVVHRKKGLFKTRIWLERKRFGK
ncbi:MAG TPA: histidine phosphatase family protein [Flavisolibacter sp.]